MKRSSIFYILLIFIINTSATYSLEEYPLNQGIVFHDVSFSEALKKAKKENKTIFLDAYTSWCGPCKKLKNFVFTDINVGAYFNSHFINLAVDMEKGEGLELARKFNVQAYPTLFFINPKGDIIKTVIGYQTADQLIQQAKSIQ